MRKRRTETFSKEYQDLQIGELIRRNTYGGSKEAPAAEKHMPIVTSEAGIKMSWNRRSDIYPSEISLKMSDGEWVSYRIDIQQPGFKNSMEILKNGSWERGYPPEGK